MSTLVSLTLCIVAANPGAPTAEGASLEGNSAIVERFPEAVELLRCDFEPPMDSNSDGWPDNWTRRRGPGFPLHVPIELTPAPDVLPAAEGAQYLRVQPNGGSAAAFSPALPASSLFSYVLEGKLRTTGLARSAAYYSLSFFDAEKKLVERHCSPRWSNAGDWHTVQIGPVAAQHAGVRTVVVGLHVDVTSGAGDLAGKALFDDLWLARVPRISLTSNSPYNVYDDPQSVEVTCRVSGILEREPQLEFELLNVEGRTLARHAHTLHTEAVAATSENASDRKGARSAEAGGYQGTASWKPSLSEHGFYRVRVTLRGERGLARHERELSLAVVQPNKRAAQGEFGWSLPRGAEPLGMKSLVGLLPQVGVHWVKFPAWVSDHDPAVEQLAWFADRLSQQGIEMVGVLDQPPEKVRSQFGEADHFPVASLFVEPQVWHPAVDPVMTRLSLKVRWWQLGADDDYSYVGYPEVETKLREIKQHLDRFGQVVNIGLSWRWLAEMPPAERPSWNFLTLSSDPPLTAAELARYLAAPKPVGVKLWTMLRPLSRGSYSVEQRAHDLVVRMMAAKQGGADVIWLPDPFSTDHGVMNDDGTPGELLLPWRTTAVALGGTRPGQSIALPQGSENQLFLRGNEGVMVVWNEHPTEEILYLGENVQQLDLWGRLVPIERRGPDHVLRVGKMPTFVTGVHLPTAGLRTSFSLTGDLTPSFGPWQTFQVNFRNHFTQGIGGTATVQAPSGWEIDPPVLRFRAAPGQELRETVRVRLRPDAASGRHEVRFDFDITADRNYKFSVQKPLHISLPHVQIETETQLNERGDLVVKQTTINQGDLPISFNCFLYAPDRRRLRQFVLHLDRGQTVNTYILPRGEELQGAKLLLRAEEIGGDRIVNLPLTVEF